MTIKYVLLTSITGKIVKIALTILLKDLFKQIFKLNKNAITISFTKIAKFLNKKFDLKLNANHIEEAIITFNKIYYKDSTYNIVPILDDSNNSVTLINKTNKQLKLKGTFMIQANMTARCIIQAASEKSKLTPQEAKKARLKFRTFLKKKFKRQEFSIEDLETTLNAFFKKEKIRAGTKKAIYLKHNIMFYKDSFLTPIMFKIAPLK